MKFIDTTGLAWDLPLTFGATLRIKAATNGKIDLLNPEKVVHGETSLCELLRDNYEEFFEVLWQLSAPQAETHGLTPEKLAERLSVETIAQAHAAFGAEWENFSRGLGRVEKAEAIRATWAYQKQLATAVLKHVQSAEHQRLQTKAEATLEIALRNYSGKLEAQLDSILAPSPGANST